MRTGILFTAVLLVLPLAAFATPCTLVFEGYAIGWEGNSETGSVYSDPFDVVLEVTIDWTTVTQYSTAEGLCCDLDGAIVEAYEVYSDWTFGADDIAGYMQIFNTASATACFGFDGSLTFSLSGMLEGQSILDDAQDYVLAAVEGGDINASYYALGGSAESSATGNYYNILNTYDGPPPGGSLVYSEGYGYAFYGQLNEVCIPCVIPEPATMTLLGLGLSGLALSRLRRRKAA